jgi:hypothetical protein
VDADELENCETFSQRCYTRSARQHKLEPGEQLYACVYRDFGAWRPVADYRNADVWIKFAAQQLVQERSDAEAKADELVDQLIGYVRLVLGRATMNQDANSPRP